MTSVGIENSIQRGEFENWAIYTRSRFSQAAESELAKYESENKVTKTPIPQHLGIGTLGAIGFLVTIFAVPILQTMVPDVSMSLIGRMDNSQIAAEDWWRPVTSLTLHADIPHLIANAFFGVILGVGLTRHLGSGYGWFLILLGGVMGNILSAALRTEHYMSLGASTAVFASLGIMATYVWRRGYYRSGGLRRSLTPLFGAVALFSFAGIGDLRTDVVAHLTGLVSGMGLGFVAARFDPRRLGKSGQFICGGLAMASVIFCWMRALG